MGITWLLCMVLEMEVTSKFLSMENCLLSNNGLVVFLGMPICSCLEQGIKIISGFDRHSNVFLDDVRFYNRALSAQEVQVQAGAFLNKIIGSYGAAFTYQVQANRGPDTYAVTAGTLPTGLSLGWFHRYHQWYAHCDR